MEYVIKSTAQNYIKGSCKIASRVRLAQYCIFNFYSCAQKNICEDSTLILKATGSGCESVLTGIESKKFG